MKSTIGLAEYLRDLVRSSRSPVRDIGKSTDVVWLRDVVEHAPVASDRALRATGEAADVFTLGYVPKAPAPQLPRVLYGRIDAAEANDPFGREPVLRSRPGASRTEESGERASVPTMTEARARAQQIKDAFEAWLADWRVWSARRREDAPAQELHERLTRFARKLSEQDDTYEAVLAVGLVEWKPADGKRVYRHLVTRRTRITIDKTARITVSMDPDSALRLEDREFLADEDAYRNDRASGVHERVAECPQHPLAPEVAELVREWANLALDLPVRYSSAWQANNQNTDGAAADVGAAGSDKSDPCVVTLAPAVILRQRTTNAVADVYDRIIEDLTHSETGVPLGLAQLVAPLEAHERAAWARGPRRWPTAELRDSPLFPLATNAEQRAVLDRLGPNTAVVVQGPPGTGKTHTIANLTAALVAQGQRVLVTSQKDQPLGVLRELIPAPVRDLCVLLAAGDRLGPSALERTLTALSERAATMDAGRLDGQIRELRRRYEALLRRKAELHEEIRTLRVAEAAVHRPAPGYEGTPADLDRLIAQDESRYAWMPQPPADCPGEFPLGVKQLAQLRDLLRTVEPEQYERLQQWFPDAKPGPDSGPESDNDSGRDSGRESALELDLDPILEPGREYGSVPVPGPEAFADLLARINVRAAAVGPLSPLGERITHLDLPGLAAIERLTTSADACLHRFGVDVRAKRRPLGDWRFKALSDALAGRNTRLWERLADTRETAERGLDAVESLGAVTLPPYLQADELTQFLSAAREWRDYLRDGGKPRAFFPAAAQARVKPLLDQCTVEGVAPTTDFHLSSIIAMLEISTTANHIEDLWRSADVRPVAGPLPQRFEQYADRAHALEEISRFSAVRTRLDDELLALDVRVSLTSVENWAAFTDALGSARERIRLEADTATRDNLAALLTAPQGSTPAPEVKALRSAVRARNAAAYATAHQDYVTARREHDDVLQIKRSTKALSAAHLALARFLVDDPHNRCWDDPAAVARAWAWAVAARLAGSLRADGRENALDDELGAVEERLLAATGELAGAEGWRHCLSRLDQRQRQALAQLRSHLSAVGAGDGRYAARARASARDAMTTARSAVPVWIMPLYQVVDTLPAEPDSFDVVIVDEASQVGLDGLFLLWLAPRVIVVGDDKQCVPSFGGGEHQKFYDHLDEYLSQIARSDRDMFRPGMNLYELLSARFPDTVRLTEHFRSMPEIIGWSSRQFYRGRLTPLRQFGADRLDPLRVEFVDGAYQEGREERVHNPAEAKQLVAKLGQLVRDPRYDRRTFGVITLQGSAQAQLIEQLITQSIDPPTRLKHRIRVGRPADFQGDERDVVMLSMVAVTPAKMLRSLNDQRRFNVAASRARDQMWLFTSVRPDLLKDGDLRFSLLSYMRTPPPATPQARVPNLAEVTGVRDHPAFDSLFEQRVFRHIRERGYVVVPQVAVGAKHIDLVVYGESARLAVECDGDQWHGTIEQQRQDIRRERELIRAGWKFWRIRESTFARDPEAALEPLWVALAARGIAPGVEQSHAVVLPDVPASAWKPIELPVEDGPEPGGE